MNDAMMKARLEAVAEFEATIHPMFEAMNKLVLVQNAREYGDTITPVILHMLQDTARTEDSSLTDVMAVAVRAIAVLLYTVMKGEERVERCVSLFGLQVLQWLRKAYQNEKINPRLKMASDASIAILAREKAEDRPKREALRNAQTYAN